MKIVLPQRLIMTDFGVLCVHAWPWFDEWTIAEEDISRMSS